MPRGPVPGDRYGASLVYSCDALLLRGWRRLRRLLRGPVLRRDLRVVTRPLILRIGLRGERLTGLRLLPALRHARLTRLRSVRLTGRRLCSVRLTRLGLQIGRAHV